jgi:hypothetical protein
VNRKQERRHAKNPKSYTNVIRGKAERELANSPYKST